ncbi:hypothetical protein LCP9604111_3804 [Penicillium roqueforti]|uniref:uncharacterized protein n=1 Tax=Penicillium roqueforti TaxID=5082 RepID=UPI00190C89E6|nr:uncharacterized protein LCP9604111_3804 [Penicillium roqueforti]KAF9250288.1 hypothetical protein LCP9604111_3804 [Penicillium roqueforti]KAI2676388.1 hypothetical protein LCP963914a_8350 [Penicillium roqueforti]KAI2700864.1 hypothetical protein CBS147372_4934 [Penicillium roqueforti]KAI2717244.1 hypothetical protein CBS147318_5371 [Penicillium roqueforti]KAI3128914.1 hypothetical protein CBS147330_5402 [Penicillium roqueforti]
MPPQPQPLSRWPHNFDDKYVFKRLDILYSPTDQQLLHDLAQEVYDIVALDALNNGRVLVNVFRSSASRDKMLIEWRKRLPRLPAATLAHVTDHTLLCGALYKYLNCIQDELQTEFDRRQNPLAEQTGGEKTAAQPVQRGVSKSVQHSIEVSEQQVEEQLEGELAHQLAQQSSPQPEQPPAEQQPQQPARSAQRNPDRQNKFDYGRPYIVPNGDVQIIRADHPDMPLAMRVSDFLTDKVNPQDTCPDGDWINIANIQFELFKQNLTREGYLRDRETIWLSHLSLDQIDPANVANPQIGEVRMAALNFASTIVRTIREYWPRLRNPSPDPFRGDRRSPLPRPNMTIIIRTGVIKGGALTPKQPALARPTEKMGSNAIAHNRRSEQVARYAAERHAKTKRKRAEAEAEAGAGAGAGANTEAETGAENEAATNAPVTRKRRITRTRKTAVTSATGTDSARESDDDIDSAGPEFSDTNYTPAPTRAPVPLPTLALAPAPVPAAVPVPVSAPAGEQLLGDVGDPMLGVLDTEMFNEEGLVGDSGGALQAFFEGNHWVGDPMDGVERSNEGTR